MASFVDCNFSAERVDVQVSSVKKDWPQIALEMRLAAASQLGQESQRSYMVHLGTFFSSLANFKMRCSSSMVTASLYALASSTGLQGLSITLSLFKLCAAPANPERHKPPSNFWLRCNVIISHQIHHVTRGRHDAKHWTRRRAQLAHEY
jgi:hypothetical protein